MRRCLKHGMLAGMAGGAALAAVLWIAGQESIGQAIAIEKASAEASAGTEMFARGTQQLGGMLASVIYGIAVGAVFAVASAGIQGRSGRGEWGTSMRLAGAGFVAVFLLPFIKYPANPPAVGDPETITERTFLYLVALAWSLVAAWSGWRLWRAMVARGVPDHVRVPAAVAIMLVLAGVGLVALPSNPDSVTAPATLVWNFRLSAAAGAAAFWGVMGSVFGWLRLSQHHPSFSDAMVR